MRFTLFWFWPLLLASYGSSTKSTDSNSAELFLLKYELDKLKTLFTTLKMEHEDLQAKYLNLQPSEPAPIVLFSAYHNKYNFEAGSYLHFKDFHADHNSGFNLSSGIFYTPLKGTYTFSFFGRHSVIESTIVQVEKNGLIVARVMGSGDNGFGDTLSYGWSLDLNPGDEVRLKVLTGTIHSGNDYTVFNGYLINPF